MTQQPFNASLYASLFTPRIVEQPTEKADSSMLPFIIIAAILVVLGIALIHRSTTTNVPALKPKVDIKNNQVT